VVNHHLYFVIEPSVLFKSSIPLRFFVLNYHVKLRFILQTLELLLKQIWQLCGWWRESATGYCIIGRTVQTRTSSALWCSH